MDKKINLKKSHTFFSSRIRLRLIKACTRHLGDISWLNTLHCALEYNPIKSIFLFFSPLFLLFLAAIFAKKRAMI